MRRPVFTGHVVAILTATANADEFLQPWTFAGPAKDYSNNLYFGVGVFIQTAWVAGFTNATIVLTQDNNPGDARGGPSVTLEESYNQTSWSWTVSYEGMDPAYNNVFYFGVMQANGTDLFIGRYFNISGASTTTKSSASPGIMTSPSSSATITVAPVTVETSSATVTVAPSSGGGTPAGTIAGIVIGIVIGSLLLVGGTSWAWKIKKRPSREQGRYEADGNQIYETAGRPIYELHNSVGQPRD